MQAVDVLIIEDTFDVRELLAEVLGGEGYSVALAEHGGVAQALIEGGLVPRVILLDLMMPVMSGDEFLEWMRRSPERCRPAVAFISAAPGALPGRVDAHFRKPLDLERLLAFVKRHCHAACA